MRFRAFAAASGLVFSSWSAGCLIYGEELLSSGAGGGGAGGSGATSTTTSAGGTTTTGTPCSAPEDCPDPGVPCQKRVCADGTCGIENLPSSTEIEDPTPGNCRALVCDSAGGFIEVESSKDIPDDGKFCTIDSCQVGEPMHKPKLGFTCNENGGKHCNDKGDCVECAVDGDCASMVCKDYECAPASCNDGTKNGSETDTDCGGACADCITGKDCKVNTDCKSNLCTMLVCAPTCIDGQKNNAETDIDCGGGTCPTCADLKSCLGASDCMSGICTNNKCAVPTCMDGKKNGTETAIDCGGASCPSCALDHMVINEIDYDQSSTDTAEFVEIYNATGAAVNLANFKLVLIDGSANAPYNFIDLSVAGSLAAGQYLVIGPAGLPIAGGALKIDFAGTMNQIQNGISGGTGAPDGVVLIDDAANKVVDALSYEGPITTADLSNWGLGTVTLVEGVALNANVKDEAGGSLCRLPNSKDANNASTDWALSQNPTPGAANVP